MNVQVARHRVCVAEPVEPRPQGHAVVGAVLRVVLDEPGHFSHFERLDFPHEQRMDVESLVALAASRSYVITATPEQRVATLDGVRELAATHPDLKGRIEFDLPYRTAVFRAKLRN